MNPNSNLYNNSLLIVSYFDRNYYGIHVNNGIYIMLFNKFVDLNSGPTYIVDGRYVNDPIKKNDGSIQIPGTTNE